jgi:hypothetical protein
MDDAGDDLATRYDRLALKRGRRSSTPPELVLSERDRSFCETVYELPDTTLK